MTTLEGRAGRLLASFGLPSGSSILIALSGGPDSTALLRFLARARQARGLALHACIVDHGIRPAGEISADIDFARGLCQGQEIPLSVGRIPAGRCRELARAEGRSLEEVAREERRRLLLKTAAREGARWIALGHTRDDLLETILMRFLQGSDVAALAGILPLRGMWIRPLLDVSRAEILDYLRSLGQGWREDATNADTSILRNRLRAVLLPVLRERFPGAPTGILSFSRKAGLIAGMLREEGRRMKWAAEEAGYSIARRSFLAAPSAVRAAELMRLYDRLRGPSQPRRLPWRFVLPALGRSLPRRGRILAGHGMQLSARGERLHWGRSIVMRGKKSYFIEVSETGSFCLPEIGVRVSFVRGSGERSSAAAGIGLLEGDIKPPLVLRSRRRGDEILLEYGATSLKELFSGWKVSEGQRQTLPILADRKGVVAVLGAVLGCPDRVRRGARADPEGDADRIMVVTGKEHGRGT